MPYTRTDRRTDRHITYLIALGYIILIGNCKLRCVHKRNMYISVRVLDIFAKNEVYSIISLGGVWPQTHRQRTCGYYSIDIIITYARLFMF